MRRLHEAAIRAARAEDVARRFAELGFDYVGSSPAGGDARLAREAVKWREVIERGNIRAEG